MARDELDLGKIGLELKRLRIEHSYTQEKIADDLGCTIAFISNIENNRTKLNLRVLTYYAKLCNVTVDSILNAGRDNESARTSSDVRDSELLNTYHQFSEEDQKKILKIIKYVKNGGSI